MQIIERFFDIRYTGEDKVFRYSKILLKLFGGWLF
jgi:hypothetical protein